MTDSLPGRIVGRIPVVDLPHTDEHLWWACECDVCTNDRNMFCEPVPAVEDTKPAFTVLKGGKKW